MLSQIERAALVGNLVTVKCREQAGDAQVDVLCIRFFSDGKEYLRPVAKLYEDQFAALKEVEVPEAYRVSGLH